MSVSLFRRWRSQKFSDLVGQESVVSTLQNVLKAGDPARAYLFCGPRGTGKTSSARIFAKALNCENGPAAEPCNECSQCRSISEGNNLDVYEIDAASHTQVDKIRDFIVEKVHFTPVSAPYKVYIIDEVHKLSTSSFNALLKTLEEPPSHVVFILATTHPHEMPSTILSRCQRYDFRPLTATETEKHLLMIAGQEGIHLEEDAARQLARAADGSLRDALVLFEQANVFAEGRVTRDSVLDLLGGVGYEVLEEMFTDLQRGDAASALRRLDSWIVRGRDLKRLAESFQDHLRMLLLLKVKSEDQSIRHLSTEERASLERLTGILSVGAITQWLRAVGEMLAQIRHGRRARLEWEMLLVALAHPESDPTLEGLERRLERVETGEGGGSSSMLDSRLMARVEALEAASSQEVDGERITSLEMQLQELGREVKRLASRPQPEQMAARTLEPPAAPREEAEHLTTIETDQPEATVPNLPVEAGLERDAVDDWLAMPDILVTGRIGRSEHTGLPHDPSSEEDTELQEKLPVPVDSQGDDPPSPEDFRERSHAPPNDFERGSQAPAPLPEPKQLKRSDAPETGPGVETPPPRVESETAGPRPRTAQPGGPPPVLPDPKEFFRLLMQGVKERDIRLHAVLADARLTSLTTADFELAVPAGYQWHFGKIQEGKELLESVARDLVSGGTLQMECSIGGEKATPPKENEHEELVKRASGVFGGSSIID